VGYLRDNALSEIIGFILILAILVIISSLYLVYVVPLQGRDAEIEHMKDIEQFFINFKMNMDSLWINNQIDIPFTSSITLGTRGPNTDGSFTVFPLLQPSGASGSISISPDDTLNLMVDGIFIGGDGNTSQIKASMISEPRTDLMYNLTTDPIQVNRTNTSVVYSTQGDWKVTLAVRNTPYVSDILFNSTGSIYQVKKNQNYDLTISVSKYNTPTLDNWTIYSNVTANSAYPINLLDEAYGLNNDVKFPFIACVTPFSPLYLTDKGYHERTVGPVSYPIGELKYESHNHYWINQNYHYILDGVFLGQANVTLPKINPGIRISNETLPDGRNIIDVYLTIFSIQGNQANISESDPIQVSGKILNITHNKIGSEELSKIKPNAKQITISFTSSSTDPNTWSQFNESLYQTLAQLIPTSYWEKNLTFNQTPQGVNLFIYGDSDKNSKDLDCYLEINQINAQLGVESYAPTTF